MSPTAENIITLMTRPEERAVDAQLQPRAELDVHETRAHAHNRKHAGDHSELRIQADGH